MASSNTSNSNIIYEGSKEYPYPSHVNAASFLSIKLSGKSNYGRWQEQMMCLVESHDMLGFIDGTLKNPQEKFFIKKKADKTVMEANYREWKRSDTLVKGWIFGSISENVMGTVVGLHTTNDVWKKLKTTYSTPAIPTSDKGPQQYPYPSHVHAASLLSIKLSGKTNYLRWMEQMMCLVESHDMLGFIDGTLKDPKEKSDSKKKANKTTMNVKHGESIFRHRKHKNFGLHRNTNVADKTIIEAKYREWKRSDTLVKGWIFGSLSEDVMGTVVGLHTTNDVWEKLKTTYSTPAVPTSDKAIGTCAIDWREYRPLYEAILNGDWVKAQEIFMNDEDALTVKINDDGDCALHLAIGTCENIQFVENLLNKIDRESLPTLVTNKKLNTLHRAAVVGNTEAAKMVVKNNPYLLFIYDNQECLPIHRAIFGSHEQTFRYLLKASKQHIGLSQQDGYNSPFKGKNGGVLLAAVIDAGFIDDAYELIKEFPYMARKMDRNYIPLKSTVNKLGAYSSGARNNFYQRFIYSLVPTENNGLGDTNKIPDIENQETYNANIVAKCTRSCFHPVIQRIYAKFWEVTLLHAVTHIKRLHEDRVKHNKALMMLKCICKEIVGNCSARDIYEHYNEAFHLAVRNDNPEAIQEIIESFPQEIWTKSNGYYLIQFAIINRCENLYNSLVHKETKNEQLHRESIDEDGNNLLHLAGQLAPIDKLSLVSGAALQLQREF